MSKRVKNKEIISRYSSVVERIIGNDEAESSILSSGTILFADDELLSFFANYDNNYYPLFSSVIIRIIVIIDY